ncbi:NADH-dependent flavin oxidoreductase [Marinifilum caeruleilacunae]|uniref:NADH-dependent flavin oxidoreductase n=1 Tax=Marinifilum caeruleilacunae TaxID=2499076 RepID=A0ABX1WQJ0_9BACT|nr:NADH-dependent flavin oxidoreductase [Marinifilum caeruleilacunae]NOU58362.1 NADH-dependent flavin oxidoreductase [Marinifilum caeruleilacunae]
MFQEFKLNKEVTLRNRFVVAPMTTWGSNDDLTVSDIEADYYAARAKGVGMFITGCTFFQANGQGFDNQFYAGTDEFIPSLKKMADAIKAGGAKAVLQIFHGGRMADPSKGELVSASAIKPNHNFFGDTIEEMPTPRELTTKEVWEFIDGFYHATVRAIKAGFEGIEIHGANTYLIQQFFSPHANRRTDEFGGDVYKRMKLVLELIKVANKARDEYADDRFIIGYRFSPEELENPGISMDDTLKLVDRLSDERIDYLHISSHHYANSSIRDKSDDRKIGKRLLQTIAGRKPLIGVGGINTKEDAEDALNNIGYDLLAIGKAIVTDPNWVEKVQNNEEPELGIDLDYYQDIIIPERFAKTVGQFEGWFKVKQSN